MSLVENFRGSAPIGSTNPRPESQQISSNRGSLQGRDVEIVPRRLSLPPPKIERLRDRETKSLDQHEVVQEQPNPRLARIARYGGLDTREQLIQRAGRPKDDISFGLFGTKSMSSGYKAILNGLDGYHQALAPNGEQPRPEQLEALMVQLGDLEGATARYMEARGHSHKYEISVVQSQIKHEKKVIQGLLDEVRGGEPLPDTMTLEEIVAFARQGIALKDMMVLHHRGHSPESARELLESEIGEPPLSEEMLKSYLDEGFNPQEAMLLERYGLGISVGKAYRRRDIPITPETIAKSFRSDNRLGDITVLGSGGFNETYNIRYDTPEGEFRGVLKQIEPPDPSRTFEVEGGWVAEKIGIDLYNPRTAMRNLSTYTVAQELGFDVIPRTEIGVMTDEGERPTVGLIMGFAKGTPGGSTPRKLYSDPDVRRELTKLQFLDHLCGQGDRHHNNYFIHRDENGRVTVTGIDNDQSFGKNLHDPNGIARGKSKDNYGFRGVNMPMVIDEDMAEAFRTLTPERLDEMLGGMLSPEEIAAAKDRLKDIQHHIETLRLNGHVIKPNEWDEPWVGEELRRRNSYVGRDGKR